MQISEAESRVMQVLWANGPSTAEEVAAALGDVVEWREATIKTFLNRLLNKGAVEAVAEGRRYRYRPLLAQEAWVTHESRGFLQRLFDGRLAPLVAHFSQQGELSREDIAELKRLIARLPDGAPRDGR